MMTHIMSHILLVNVKEQIESSTDIFSDSFLWVIIYETFSGS